MNFLGYLLVITGGWDILDTCLWESTVERDAIYFTVGVLGCFLVNDLLAPESVYFMASKRGHNLQKQNYKEKRDVFDAHCFCGTHPWVPNESLYPVQDEFVRDVIHPIVREFISPGEVYVIETWNYFNAVILILFFDLLQWVGLWNLLDYHYIWTDDPMTKIMVYMAVGYIIIAFSFILGRVLPSSDKEDSWKLGIPSSFGFRRKTKNFIRSCVSFVGYLFFWVGAGNMWDMEQEDVTVYVAYLVVSTVFYYLSTELLSIDALFYLATMWTIKWREWTGTKESDEDPTSYILDEDI